MKVRSSEFNLPIIFDLPPLAFYSLLVIYRPLWYALDRELFPCRSSSELERSSTTVFLTGASIFSARLPCLYFSGKRLVTYSSAFWTRLLFSTRRCIMISCPYFSGSYFVYDLSECNFNNSLFFTKTCFISAFPSSNMSWGFLTLSLQLLWTPPCWPLCPRSPSQLLLSLIW